MYDRIEIGIMKNHPDAEGKSEKATHQRKRVSPPPNDYIGTKVGRRPLMGSYTTCDFPIDLSAIRTTSLCVNRNTEMTDKIAEKIYEPVGK